MPAVKRILFKFKVTGNSPFPLDMLRYDRCFPASERDSSLIATMLAHENTGYLTVELLTYQELKNWLPTTARWKSRSWEVHPSALEEVV